MSASKRRVDRWLLLIVGMLLAVGTLTFASGAFGLLARGETHISAVAFNHVVLGIGVGLVLLVICTTIDHALWKHWAMPLYVISILITALVFIPSLGLEHGGGVRWLNLGPFSFQPAETMKLGAILIAAAYFSAHQKRIGTMQFGVGGFFAILAAPAAVLILQPDIGTLGIIVASVGTVYLAAGARFRHVALLAITGLLLIAVLAYTRPYVMDRLATFWNPDQNPQGEGWQIQQSLIAIGSGGFTGRGFGQGVQKFTYLPEPMGDSVFAVAAEELGFVGGALIIALFLVLAVRGFAVSTRSPDAFGALLGIGIATYISVEAFINIGSMLGIVPLTGVPLIFFSQGGSAMLVALGSVGILLSISRRGGRT